MEGKGSKAKSRVRVCVRAEGPSKVLELVEEGHKHYAHHNTHRSLPSDHSDSRLSRGRGRLRCVWCVCAGRVVGC